MVYSPLEQEIGIKQSVPSFKQIDMYLDTVSRHNFHPHKKKELKPYDF